MRAKIKKQTNAHAFLLILVLLRLLSFFLFFLFLSVHNFILLLYSITQARQNQQLALRRIIPHPELD